MTTERDATATIKPTIERRLARLERQNRRFKAAFVGLASLAVAATLFGFAAKEPVPDLIQARAIHVVNKDGNPLVKLTTIDDDTLGQIATASTTSGHDLVQIAAMPDGKRGMVRTLNERGQDLVQLATTAEGFGTVTTLNGKGQYLVGLAATKNGSGFVVAMDPSGQMQRGMLAPTAKP